MIRFWIRLRSALTLKPGLPASHESEDRVLLVLTLLIAVLTSLTIVGFVAITERLGANLLAAGPLLRFLSPLLGSLLSGILLFRFFPEARGSGIPQTRVALLFGKGFISLRTVIGKFLCSSISLGSGIALGREGPSVHLGAGLASVIGRNLGVSEQGVRALIPVGTAAAVAAAFNTPLAAVLFTLEEILADLHARLIGSVVLAAATSWMILHLLLGDEPIFHVPAYRLVHPLEFLIYLILGLTCGLVSTLFVKGLLWLRGHFLKTPARWMPFAPAAGGLVVGTLAIAFPGVLGVGYHLVSEALNGQLGLKAMLLLLLLKLIATTSSYSSGNAGGVFGPSLFIGAMTGGVIGQAAHLLLPDLTASAGAYALVGMGACFAGIIRTPMTSVIMIFEITRDYTIIVPLMIANLLSYLVSRRLQPLPLYEALLAQTDIRMPSPSHRPEPLIVDNAMRKSSLASLPSNSEGQNRIHPDDSLDMALQFMGKTGNRHLPVWSRMGNQILGSIHHDDCIAAYLSAPAPTTTKQPAHKNWLPVLALSTFAALVLIAGLVVWQRSNRLHSAEDAFKAGQSLLAQGRTVEAVQDFRLALASNPGDNRTRIALGIALIESGNSSEAAAYLQQALEIDPTHGPTLVGLARLSKSAGDLKRAHDYMQKGLAAKWLPQEASSRVDAQLEYALLLYQSGKASQATTSLLSLIEQSGDFQAAGEKAADTIQQFDSSTRAEEAYTLLAERFPANSAIWTNLARSRFSNGKELNALQAYREAARLSPDSDAIRSSLALVEKVLNLDPGRPRLSLRERGRRWNEILAILIQETSACGESPEHQLAKRLLNTKNLSLEVLDRKVAAVLELWDTTADACKQDPALSRILSRLR